MSKNPYKKWMSELPSFIDPGNHQLDSPSILVDEKKAKRTGGDAYKRIKAAKIIRTITGYEHTSDKYQVARDFIQFNWRLIRYADRLDACGKDYYYRIVASNLDEFLCTKVNGIKDIDVLAEIAEQFKLLYDHIDGFAARYALSVLHSVQSATCTSSYNEVMTIEPGKCYVLAIHRKGVTYLPHIYETGLSRIDELAVRILYNEESSDDIKLAILKTYPNNDTLFDSTSMDAIQDITDTIAIRKSCSNNLPMVFTIGAFDRDDTFGLANAVQFYTGAPNFIERTLTNYHCINENDIHVLYIRTDFSYSLAFTAPRYSDTEFKDNREFIYSESRSIKQMLDEVGYCSSQTYRTPLDIPYRKVLEFIDMVVRDDHVKSIYMTLYRVADNSAIVDSLIAAAMRGKKVKVYVEITASGDEERNVDVVRKLSAIPGIKVYTRFLGMKVHAKMFVAKVDNPNKPDIKYYVHTSTGNYNETTAEQYLDMQYFSTNPEDAKQLLKLFKSISNQQIDCNSGDGVRYRSVLLPMHGFSSVNQVKFKILEMLDEIREIIPLHDEIIVYFKCNHLMDCDIIDAIYALANEGVVFNLIVRSTCSISARTNINIYHPVGEFLEHDRIYAYECRDLTQKRRRAFISSADLMYRNLYNRAETIMEVEEHKSLNRIFGYLQRYSVKEISDEGVPVSLLTQVVYPW